MRLLLGEEALLGEEDFFFDEAFLGDETGRSGVRGEERIGSSRGCVGCVSKSGSWKEVGSGTGKLSLIHI